MGFVEARSEHAANSQMKRESDLNAARSAEQQYSALGRRAQQEDQATAQEKQELDLEAARQAATVEVAAGGAGVSGASLEYVLADIYAGRGRNEATLDANQRMSRGYLEEQMAGAQIGSQSAINAAAKPMRPSVVPYAMDAFSTGLNSYTSRRKQKNGV